jgi:hypothetical protein
MIPSFSTLHVRESVVHAAQKLPRPVLLMSGMSHPVPYRSRSRCSERASGGRPCGIVTGYDHLPDKEHWALAATYDGAFGELFERHSTRCPTNYCRRRRLVLQPRSDLSVLSCAWPTTSPCYFARSLSYLGSSPLRKMRSATPSSRSVDNRLKGAFTWVRALTCASVPCAGALVVALFPRPPMLRRPRPLFQ